MALIEFRGVKKAFGPKVIYRGLDLSIEAGEALTIIGGSGQGKSVMLRMLIGLLSVDAGEIYFDGQRISGLSEAEYLPIRRRVAMLFQAAALFDSMTVGDNVAYGLRSAGELSEAEIEERVHESLGYVGLEGRHELWPGGLSSGMKKRVGLARAIAMRPDVLLYDEPTTGLDPININRIIDLILHLQSTLNITSVVVTHDMYTAIRVSNRIAMIDGGGIIFSGGIRDVVTCQDPRVKDFIEGNAAAEPHAPLAGSAIYMQANKKTQLQVGLFVMVALGITATLAFVVGAQQNLFTRKTEFVAIFESVDGLRPGSVVTVAGVNVGSVSSVEFAEDGRIEVRFNVVDSAAGLIRGRRTGEGDAVEEGSSVVSIGSKGMLGDKLMQVTVGRRQLPVWDPEVPLPANASGDLMALAGSAMTEVQGTAENLRLATDPFRDQEFSHDVTRIAANLARVTDMLANGNGAIQHLMTDEGTAAELDATLENLRATSDEFARTARSIRRVTEEVERGDGTAHALIYGDEGREAVVNIGRATGEVATILEDVRTGDGTVHDFVYGDAGQELLANLTRASDDVASITADVRAGRGTIGGLLQDPSIYEDIKRLVGDLERNEILRALVRYSVRRDEARRPARVRALDEEGEIAGPADGDPVPSGGAGDAEEAP